MRPSRELDALVAEKIMGWTSCEITSRTETRLMWPPDSPKNVFEYKTDGLMGPNKELRVPSYSTDIAAAWEVVEKIRSRQDYVCFEISSEWKGENCPADKNFYARFCIGRGTLVGYSDSAPTAICLAALEAIHAG